jgi:hypothetical protein
MSRPGPRLPSWARRQVGSYPGYTGRPANVVRRAALGPDADVPRRLCSGPSPSRLLCWTGGAPLNNRPSGHHSPVGQEHGRTIPLAVIGLPAFAERNTKPVYGLENKVRQCCRRPKRFAERDEPARLGGRALHPLAKLDKTVGRPREFDVHPASEHLITTRLLPLLHGGGHRRLGDSLASLRRGTQHRGYDP